MSETQESTLYDGHVKVKFNPDSHRYSVNGKPQTGVTTYLGIKDKSRPLTIWATELYRDFLLGRFTEGITLDDIYEGCSLHEQKKQEAASIGTEVHDWVEKYIKGLNPEMPESKEAQIGVTAFLEWADAHEVKFISSERVVYSRKHKFIGKMDIEATVNGKHCLIDLKTSNRIYNDYSMQTAAYVRADEEEGTVGYDGRWIIRLAKETELEYRIRMEKKNANRLRKGQNSVGYEPYQVFEARFLDEDDSFLNRDFEAFLHAKKLFEWNKLTDNF